MVPGSAIVLISLVYVGVLFGIAYWGDQRAERGRSLIRNPLIYALSLGVYCTAWTYYGSVGRAAATGLGFLPVYLGPTLMAILWTFVLRKMVRISKINRITTIADFVASRYGKSTLLGGLVTVIAVVGVAPYISLQLDAVSTSFMLLQRGLGASATGGAAPFPDTALLISLAMAAFAVLFGTRHLDVTEHHEGLVAAIAFESIVKLAAFLAAGFFICFVLFRGPGDIFVQAQGNPTTAALLTFHPGTVQYTDWFWLTVLSMLAILFLPRQFQMAVLENTDERHIARASWLFPLYLLIINLFVLPIALAGNLTFGAAGAPPVEPDMYVLALTMAAEQPLIALVVFIGGLSAATSMVIVETVALSTMVSNDLVMPLLLRTRLVRPAESRDYSGLLLLIRRVAIVAILLLGYLYVRSTGATTSLVSIGLISFAAVAQFAPAVLGGIYWKHGTRLGALAGLLGGFLVWGYTLSLPSLGALGGLPAAFVTDGPWGLGFLRPQALFGVTGLDPVTHSLVWSLLLNVAAYVGVSLLWPPNVLEHSQALRFVDVFNYSSSGDTLLFWRGKASVAALRSLLVRFLGERRTQETLALYARQRGLDLAATKEADAELVQYCEKLLAGVMGTASAHVAMASVVQEERLDMDEVLRLLDETSQVLAYSRQLEERTAQLEQKSLALEAATAELRTANQRLQELDRLKDDFISTVTHELRTPLTSIRAFTEILYDNPHLDVAQRTGFLEIVLKESERLTRLINQVLVLAKLESGAVEWQWEALELEPLVDEAITATAGLYGEKGVQVEKVIPRGLPRAWADHDQVMLVLVNLLSNARKFCAAEGGRVVLRSRVEDGCLLVEVSDNGPGISQADQANIFDNFRQAAQSAGGRPPGTGLGLPISAQIVAHLGGELWVESQLGQGATFAFTLPPAHGQEGTK
jgi:Na+/proline symporter/nitrogen-specific signal transduction histidine kinase